MGNFPLLPNYSGEREKGQIAKRKRLFNWNYSHQSFHFTSGERECFKLFGNFLKSHDFQQEKVKAICEEITFLRDIHEDFYRAVTIQVSLENIVKVSITGNCGSCKNLLESGTCSFSGCHAILPEVDLSCKALLFIEDLTANANLFITGWTNYKYVPSCDFQILMHSSL